jgi:hypothetical protein
VKDDQHSGACPEPEQLAAYIDGRVTVEERAAIQRHLADCDDCREVVADAVRLRDEPHARVLPFWRRPRTQVLGGGLLALAASLILVVQVRPELNPWRRSTPRADLIAAMDTSRTIEGRLTGGFAYAPLRTPTRGTSAPPATNAYALLAAAARIREAAAENPNADNLHLLGTSNLVQDDYDAALNAFARAASIRDSAALQADLAAAYLARGRATNRRDDYDRALEAAERSIQLDRSAEGLFNRALALDALGRRADARNAWLEYLAIDSSSPWAGEARFRADADDRSQQVPRKGVSFLPASAFKEHFEGNLEIFVGGKSRPTAAEDFPVSYWANERCSATAVGPRVLVSAGHCFDGDTSVSILHRGRVLNGSCQPIEWLPYGRKEDVALCDIEEITQVRFETVAIRPFASVGDRLMLTGFGGDPVKGFEAGTHLAGDATITGIREAAIDTVGGAFLVKGDSGGAGFAERRFKRFLISVNAAVDSTLKKSRVVGLFAIADIIKRWAHDGSQRRICGVNFYGNTCR